MCLKITDANFEPCESKMLGSDGVGQPLGANTKWESDTKANMEAVSCEVLK